MGRASGRAPHIGLSGQFLLFFWPQSKDDVEAYVKTLIVCQQDKVEEGAPAFCFGASSNSGESVGKHLLWISSWVSPRVKDEIGSLWWWIDSQSMHATFLLFPLQ